MQWLRSSTESSDGMVHSLIDSSTLADLRRRLSATRLVRGVDGHGWEHGTGVHHRETARVERLPRGSAGNIVTAVGTSMRVDFSGGTTA